MQIWLRTSRKRVLPSVCFQGMHNEICSDDNWLSCAEAFRPYSFVSPPFDGFTTSIL